MNKEKFYELFKTEPLALQEPHELQWLIEKVEKIDPRIIVEVGIDKGGTLKFWDAITDKDTLIIGIDINNALEYKSDKIRTIFADSTKPEAFSELYRILDGRKIDFLHLDGCHEGIVFSDYNTFGTLVRTGGIIAFHDCGEPTIFYHQKHGAISTRWVRGGAPDVQECFFSIKNKRKELLQYDQGTGVVYV